jgi:hypothetical protein
MTGEVHRGVEDTDDHELSVFDLEQDQMPAFFGDLAAWKEVFSGSPSGRLSDKF